jgi:2-succinyl-5-enolpyruvyl-6-hydroxy-3-cyclohexene-1-carboxylate synthase
MSLGVLQEKVLNNSGAWTDRHTIYTTKISIAITTWTSQIMFNKKEKPWNHTPRISVPLPLTL